MLKFTILVVLHSVFFFVNMHIYWATDFAPICKSIPTVHHLHWTIAKDKVMFLCLLLCIIYLMKNKKKNTSHRTQRDGMWSARKVYSTLKTLFNVFVLSFSFAVVLYIKISMEIIFVFVAKRKMQIKKTLLSPFLIHTFNNNLTKYVRLLNVEKWDKNNQEQAARITKNK